MAFVEMDVKTDIKRRLALLITDIRLGSKKNLHDVNVFSEGFIGELLNIIWDVQLADLNTFEVINTPGIDLGDKQSSLCIQVTSSPRREKIRKTINTYLEEKQFDDYSDLRFIFLSVDRPNLEKPIKRQTELAFTLSDHIYNADDILTEIYKLPHDKLLEVHRWMKDNIRLDETNPSTAEAVILKKYFERIRNLNIPSDPLDSFDSSDIDAKREYFEEFWKQITIDYNSCLDRTLEKRFEKVFSSMNESDRERIKRYLKSVSISLLLEYSNPVVAIEKMKTKMIEDLQMHLISEVEVKNFLYYQLYRCRVFPLEVLYASSTVR